MARLVLCDDDNLFSVALSAAIRALGTDDVVALCQRPDELSGTVARVRPTACLLEVEYAGRLRLDLLSTAREACPDTTIVVLTRSTSAELPRVLDRGLAQALVSKSESFDTLVHVLRRAMRGKREASAFTSRVAGTWSWPDDPLTEREADVLRLLAEGESTQEMAGTLGVSVNTVRTHVAHLLRKLGAANRGKAVTQAFRLGILDGRASTYPTVAHEDRSRKAEVDVTERTG